eukprot:CAMPEP_0168255964 /NCGR_PEP_ID=MMETSP0141_2-20121125/5562_1 /TAXON_ID=44445 /ORGANISM="Pseudo-nitzschia australis, Strain 10249 10 AB" /LENGTH=103 /DNA_ID=CAMNT_0008192553 /DNA_START=47 /DNA_END=355 /DNA_ORIENTATION=+
MARTAKVTDAHESASTTPAPEYNSREKHSENNDGGDNPGNTSNNIDRISPLQGNPALAHLDIDIDVDIDIDIDHLSLLLDGGATSTARTSAAAANNNNNNNNN